MKKVFLLVTFFVLHSLTFAQENFIDAQIVNAKNDTIYGQIDFRDWAYNPSKIRFRKSELASIVTYEPQDINGFEVKGMKYQSALVKIGTDSQKTSSLDDNANLNTTEEYAFLQTIVEGSKSLYMYKNIDERYFYYIKTDRGFDLLQYKKYLGKNRTGSKVIKENNVFIGQLILYLEDCETIKKTLSKTKYNLGSLRKLFYSYYDCVGQPLPFVQEKEKITGKWGLVAGYNSTSLAFESSDKLQSQYVNFKGDPDNGFTLGLSLELIFPKNNGKWTLQNDLTYTAYEFEQLTEDYMNNHGYSTTNRKLGMSYLKLNNLLRYNYPLSGIILFANLGISNGLAIQETNEKVQEIMYNGELEIRSNKFLNESRKYEQGFLLGLGLKLKRVNFEYRHERANGMSVYSKLQSKVNRNAISVNYQF